MWLYDSLDLPKRLLDKAETADASEGKRSSFRRKKALAAGGKFVAWPGLFSGTEGPYGPSNSRKVIIN